MTDSPFNPGQVEWTGENPGMYLKQDPAADWTSLLCFFRITWSPHGIGHALVLLDDPSASGPDALNLCLTDNEPMARFLVEGFMSSYGAFKGRKIVRDLPYVGLDAVSRSGDSRSSYTEHVKGHGLEVDLVWSGLGAPYATDMPPEHTATGRHQMYSLFIDSDDARCLVNGRRLPGRVVPRVVAGREGRSAFLAFSETWIRK